MTAHEHALTERIALLRADRDEINRALYAAEKELRLLTDLRREEDEALEEARRDLSAIQRRIRIAEATAPRNVDMGDPPPERSALAQRRPAAEPKRDRLLARVTFGEAR